MFQIPLFKVLMSPYLQKGIIETLFSGHIGQGEEVEKFESELSNTIGVDNLLTVNSCTSAIQLALHLVKEQDGDEVLMPPLGCFAMASSVLANNLSIKWVDVDLHTFNIDLKDLENKLSSTTKIVLLVHFGGRPVDLDHLNEILDRHEKKYGFRPHVIEDCAHAFGSKYKDKYVGSHGNICCFSFQAIKLLTTGDGGAIVLPNKELYERAKLLRWYGLSREFDIKNQNIKEFGFKYHMNDIAAKIGNENLYWIKDQNLLNRSSLYSIEEKNFKSNNWLYPILVDNRGLFEEMMKKKGVQVSPAHYRCDKHECVKKFYSDLPQMDLIEKKMTCIPSGWWVTEEDAAYIKQCMKEINV